MAAVQAALDSMSPEQRAQLQALAESLFEDMDLRWQVDRLAGNLQKAVPGAGWGRRYRLRRGPARQVSTKRRLRLARLGEMDQLEQFLRSAASPGALAEVDLEQAREYLGEDGARSLQRLANLANELEDAGLINRREGRYELTAKAIRRIGQKALSELFAKLTKDRPAGHRAAFIGHRPRARGPDEALRVRGSRSPCTSNERCTTRCGGRDRERRSSFCPTTSRSSAPKPSCGRRPCSMVDLSLSMPMRDNFLAAKKVAIALHTLISTQFPRDFLGLVGFSEVAREIKPEELPGVSWDYVYGTNMQHGLLLARRMLAHRHGTKQIIMITDGEPTAHLVPDGDRRQRGLLQLPAGRRNGPPHAGRGRPMHEGRDHDQHLHARSRPFASGIRRADVAAQPRPGVLHQSRRTSATTCSSTSWSTGAAGARESVGRTRQRCGCGFSQGGSGRGTWRSGSATGPWRSRPGPGMWGR